MTDRTPTSCGACPGARARHLALALSLAALVVAAFPAGAAAGGGVVPGRYIVVYKARAVGNVDAATDHRQAAKGFRARARFRSAVKGFAARLSPLQVDELRHDPAVAYVAPDRIRRAASIRLAAGETAPTGVRRIGAASTGAVRAPSGVGVAVLDTGIDLASHDLNLARGPNCITPGAASQDDDGHGTHVAGTIGARDTGAGVVGVAPDTRLYAVKVLDATGAGSDSQIICGLDWVTSHAAALHIRVVNMSLGGEGVSDRDCGASSHDPLHAAVCRLTQAGVTPVVAAGNDGRDFGGAAVCLPATVGTCPDTPAAYPEVLTATAMADRDGRPGGSGGRTCDGESDDAAATLFSDFATRAAEIAHTVAAPGSCILSTRLGGGTTNMSGTSMAAPHVAGAVALCLDDGHRPGPCAGHSAAGVIQTVRAEAAAHTNAVPGDGFAGDPLRADVFGHYYGFLVRPPVPSPGAPAQHLAVGAGLGASTVPVTLAWSAPGDVTEPGALRYDVQQRVRSGAWSTVVSGRGYRSAMPSLRPRSVYQFRVRARDAAGNASGWSTGSPFSVGAPQESSASYRGAWRISRQRDASGGFVRSTTRRGARASLGFGARREVAVVMPRRRTLGTVRVCLDPRTRHQSCSTVDLSPSRGLGARRIVFARGRLSPSLRHRVELTVLRGRADLDAFLLL